MLRKMKITWRIWLLIIVLFIALIMIHPRFEDGVTIKSVAKESPAAQAGLLPGMLIKEINGKSIESLTDYTNAVSGIFTEGQEARIEVNTDSGSFIFLSESLNMSVGEIPRTNIKTGLDLSGGSRAFVKAENISLTEEQLQDLVSVTSQRLNVFGLSDINVRPISDLGGNRYMLVEVAGATPEDLRELVGKQGKFEAKVGNISVFEGGKNDISDVCRNKAECAGITACSPDASGYTCTFRFTVYLTQESAQKHADVTKNISLDPTGRYLSEKLNLFIDDEMVDELFIGAELKGRATTEISIQGPGVGSTEEIALKQAKDNMNKLQTILITGSLPYKLSIVKIDTISPSLGREFTKSLLILGAAVFIVVSILIFLRYRKVNLALAVMLTMFAEAFITIGIAAFINWNLDAPGLAGIIAGIGTGVGDQILLLDASRKEEGTSGLKDRIKMAFFIIVGSFVTSVASMLPLFWTGAGLLRGFALTTIIGISVGILITRPAFSDIVKIMEE